MDMEEILNVLYELAAEPDPMRIKAFRQAVKIAEPHYKRLRAALGDEEGETIWNAAMDVETSVEGPIFQAGLRLGVRLMAMCLV